MTSANHLDRRSPSQFPCLVLFYSEKNNAICNLPLYFILLHGHGYFTPSVGTSLMEGFKQRNFDFIFIFINRHGGRRQCLRQPDTLSFGRSWSFSRSSPASRQPSPRRHSPSRGTRRRHWPRTATASRSASAPSGGRWRFGELKSLRNAYTSSETSTEIPLMNSLCP